jgi:ribosomal protein S18 acetylase RimI-like enzyme
METAMNTPRGTVTIRPATVDDAPAYRDLRLEALRHHPEAFSADYAAALAQPMSFWIERLRSSGAENGVANPLAVQDQQLIGMCAVFRGNTPKTQHSATIVGMYVQPEWRGLHVAEQLVNACVNHARQQGAKIVKLAVVTTNIRAIRSYARTGFHVYGVEPQALYYDGVYYDELLMARMT